MLAYNRGLVKQIRGIEYELMAHTWHNPDYNIIATNLPMDNGGTMQVCYAKNIKDNTEVATVYRYKSGELHFYYSRSYNNTNEIPVKYHDIIIDLMKAYSEINFDKLVHPEKTMLHRTKSLEDGANLGVKITSFRIMKDVLYCDILIKGSNVDEFVRVLKIHSDKPKGIKTEKYDAITRISDIEFSDLRIALMSFVKSNKINITSGVNLDSIPNSKAKMIVVETFKRISNYYR